MYKTVIEKKKILADVEIFEDDAPDFSALC